MIVFKRTPNLKFFAGLCAMLSACSITIGAVGANATVTSGITVSTQPSSQRIESGEQAVFTAAAQSDKDVKMQWQRSQDSGKTWEDIRFATSNTLTVPHISSENDGWQYRAKFSNQGNPDGVFSKPAGLIVTARKNIREHCAGASGPGDFVGQKFCFTGPEKVLPGQNITISGTSNWLATDGKTGSVPVFLLDAKKSGDPDTIYAKNPQANPADGKVITDARVQAVTQADANGTWQVTVPAPSIENLSPAQDLSTSFTQAEFDTRFGIGTNHSVRILTGSTLASDVLRGAQIEYTVVNSLATEVPLHAPLTDHQTFDSGNTVAWIPLKVSSGFPVKLTGTGWLSADNKWGSKVLVRLLDGNGNFYKNPNSNSNDPTVWTEIIANERGELLNDIELPADAKAKSFVAVELESKGDNGDVARKWDSAPLIIDGVPFVQKTDNASCDPENTPFKILTSPEMQKPAANIAGTIHLVGSGFCNTAGGGSLIGVKINNGSISHKGDDIAQHFDANIGKITGDDPTELAHSNKTLWFVIEADKNGNFDVNMPLPNRTNSTPAFKEGVYQLQFLTRTLAEDPYYKGARPADPQRTLKSAKFTVVAEDAKLEGAAPGKPSEIPLPLHAQNDLTDTTTGGVTASIDGDKLTVKAPSAKPGDYAYVTLFDGLSPRTPWGVEWFKVTQDKTLVAPVAGVTLPGGHLKLSVQDRDGKLLGWTWVDLPQSAPADSAKAQATQAQVLPQQPVQPQVAPPSPAPQPEPQVSTVRPFVFPGVTATTKAAPPALIDPNKVLPTQPAIAPVADYVALVESNKGEIVASEAGDKLTITTPREPGDWLFMHLYSKSGAVIPIAWLQEDPEHHVFAELGALPPGEYKLSFTDRNNTLIGWTGFSRKATTSQTQHTQQSYASSSDVPHKQTPAKTAHTTRVDLTWIYYVAAGLVLLLSIIIALVISRKKTY